MCNKKNCVGRLEGPVPLLFLERCTFFNLMAVNTSPLQDSKKKKFSNNILQSVIIFYKKECVFDTQSVISLRSLNLTGTNVITTRTRLIYARKMQF
jgi:hypothetical protein